MPHALVHTTTHLVCFSTHLICLGIHLLCLCSLYYILHALVHTTCLGTHYYTPYLLVHTTMHLIWIHTRYYTYALVHTTAHVSCFGCAMRNSTLKKDELCARFFLNNSNSFRLTKLKLTVNIVGVLKYIHTKVQASMMCSFCAILKFAEIAQLHSTRHYEIF